MSFCKAIPCITKMCSNYAADDIRYSGMCPACYQADCEAGQEQALVMRDNLHKFGTVDKPAVRKPAEVLELALTLLDLNKDSYFMCYHLEWMAGKGGYISDDECTIAQQAVRHAISYLSTLSVYLWVSGEMPMSVAARDPEYRPYQVKFYTDLVNKLKQEENQ